jgi:hypothetical protein
LEENTHVHVSVSQREDDATKIGEKEKVEEPSIIGPQGHIWMSCIPYTMIKAPLSSKSTAFVYNAFHDSARKHEWRTRGGLERLENRVDELE